MSPAELKLDLFRKLDSLDNHSIKNLYGMVLNFINAQKSSSEWDDDDLSDEQKQSLIDAEKAYHKKQFISHEQVVAKYKNKGFNG